MLRNSVRWAWWRSLLPAGRKIEGTPASSILTLKQIWRKKIYISCYEACGSDKAIKYSKVWSGVIFKLCLEYRFPSEKVKEGLDFTKWSDKHSISGENSNKSNKTQRIQWYWSFYFPTYCPMNRNISPCFFLNLFPNLTDLCPFIGKEIGHASKQGIGVEIGE